MTDLVIKYPIYIISKGRAESAMTAKFLLSENIPFTIAVEPQEYEAYRANIPKEFVAALPFSNLGLGSYPARNWCWENSILKGHAAHFLFDDNIRGFKRLNNGKRRSCNALLALLTLQSLYDRYDNLSMAGYNYMFFVTQPTKAPFFINTHVYSGLLINNSIPYRWRLKYNEDVDLNLQALNDRWSTILLNAFVIDKVSTIVKMKGGNQDELYKNNDDSKKLLKSKSLQEMWPQYVKVCFRFGRPHHQVSWGKFFKQPLKKKINYNEIIADQEALFNSLKGYF